MAVEQDYQDKNPNMASVGPNSEIYQPSGGNYVKSGEYPQQPQVAYAQPGQQVVYVQQPPPQQVVYVQQPPPQQVVYVQQPPQQVVYAQPARY